MTTSQYAVFVGGLNLWFFVLILPNHLRLFSNAQELGYLCNENSKLNAIFTRNFAKFISGLWVLASVISLLGRYNLVTSLILLSICHFFFIFMRYQSLSRGLGAPGYFITWINFTNFIFLLVGNFQSDSVALIAKIFLAELGVIFIISGSYKLTAGYQNARGMNVGLNNPQWSYWPRLWVSFSEGKFRTNLLNKIAAYGEILGGVFLLSIKFQIIGSVILALMFFGVALTVRLGNLCFLIIFSLLSPLIVQGPKNSGENLFPSYAFERLAIIAFLVSITMYLSLLVNYYSSIRFPKKFQKVLNLHIRFFGTSVWRVFTADMTSIYIEIYDVTKPDSPILVSDWSNPRGRRFRFVGEAITVTSLFTMLKYQEDKSNTHFRILTHARSLSLPKSIISYRYFYVDTANDLIVRRFVREFQVNLKSSTVEEITIDKNFDPSAPEKSSRTSIRENYGTFR